MQGVVGPKHTLVERLSYQNWSPTVVRPDTMRAVHDPRRVARVRRRLLDTAAPGERGRDQRRRLEGHGARGISGTADEKIKSGS